MIEMIFKAFSAWNQILFLCGGAICLGLAALVCVGVIQQRQRCVRVKGRIVAVRCGGVVSGATVDDPVPEPETPPGKKETFRQAFKKDPAAGILGLAVAFVILIVPLAFLGAGAYFSYNYYHLLATGIKTEAKIADIDSKRDSEGGTTYYAVVAFKDRQGNSVRADDRISSSHLSYKRGDKVTIFYDAGDPQRFVTADFWHNMTLPIVFMGMGGLVLFLLFGLPRMKKSLKDRKQPGRKKKYGMIESASHYYYPVYEYTTPQGETKRVHTTSGSNMLANKIPGKKLTLLVNPDEPWSADPPGILPFVLIVFLLGLPGIIFTGVALTSFEFNIFSVLFALGILGFLGLKIKKTIKPRDQWEKPSEFKQRRREERRKKHENPPGYIMNDTEFRQRLEALDRYALLWNPVLIIAALGLFWGGFHLSQEQRDFARVAVSVPGEVIALHSKRSSGSDGGYTYYPYVEFRDEKGRRHQFEGRFGSDPPLHKTGGKVDVLYDPLDPDKARIDYGIFNSLPALGCWILGGLMSWGALAVWIGISRRRVVR